MVDLPEADRPVNQTVQPFCLRSSLRSLRVRPACHVMLLAPRSACVTASGSCSYACGSGMVGLTQRPLIRRFGGTYVAIAVSIHERADLSLDAFVLAL